MTKKASLPDCCADALEAALRPDLFKALCDPVRISIVATMAARAEASTVTDIADGCGVDFSGVSRHLKALKEAGVLSSVREGRNVLYHLDTDLLATTLRSMADAVEACRSTAIGGIKK